MPGVVNQPVAAEQATQSNSIHLTVTIPPRGVSAAVEAANTCLHVSSRSPVSCSILGVVWANVYVVQLIDDDGVLLTVTPE